MKSPDDIKKGLECCTCDDKHDKCVRCPYYDGTCNNDLYAIEKDALVLIQQLEEERDTYRETVKNIAGCNVCVHLYDDLDDDPPVCKACERMSNWQWCGAQKEVESDEFHQHNEVT